MNKSLKNQLKQIESRLGKSVLGDVIFKIGGQEEDGEAIETMVFVEGKAITMDDFKNEYPNFKPAGIEIVLGEWDD